MTPVSLGDSTYLHFGTSSASTGAATDADSTPTVFVAEDGSALAYAPTVTNIATGLYMVQIDATAGNGFAAGQRYSVYVVATVGGVTGRDGIGEFEVLAVDLNTSLDAAITSRMATYTQPAGFLAATFPGTVASPTNITAGTLTSVGSVTGDVAGNVLGSVASVVAGVELSASGSVALTESYRANGAEGTLPELLYEIIAHLGEATIAGTTKTIAGLDHTTPVETFTLNDATAPTSITRAT